MLDDRLPTKRWRGSTSPWHARRASFSINVPAQKRELNAWGKKGFRGGHRQKWPLSSEFDYQHRSAVSTHGFD